MGAVSYQIQFKATRIPVASVNWRARSLGNLLFPGCLWDKPQTANATATLKQTNFWRSYPFGIQGGINLYCLYLINNKEGKTELEVRKSVVEAYGKCFFVVRRKSVAHFGKKTRSIWKKNLFETKRAFFENGLGDEESVGTITDYPSPIEIN